MSTTLVSAQSAKTSDSTLSQKTLQFYQAHQQVKYLHLQAEIEVLLQQLHNIKQQHHQA